MRIPPRLFRRLLVSAFAPMALAVVTEGVALANQSCAFRAATAEEQKFYADAFAQFQKIAPPAPAGWAATDTLPPGASNGVAKEVCAAPGKLVLYASFERSYNLAAQEVRAREAELVRKLAALMEENNAATKAGKPVNWEAFDAAKKKLGAEAERDTVAQLRFSVGHNAPNTAAFSPVQVPVGKGYRQVFTDDSGLPHQDLIIVLNPATPVKSALSVVMINGDPARVEALLKAMPLR